MDITAATIIKAVAFSICYISIQLQSFIFSTIINHRTGEICFVTVRELLFEIYRMWRSTIHEDEVLRGVRYGTAETVLYIIYRSMTVKNI